MAREYCPLCKDHRSRRVTIQGGRLSWFCFRCEVGGSEPIVTLEKVPEPPPRTRSIAHGNIPAEYLVWLGQHFTSVRTFRQFGGFWDGNRLSFNCSAFQARRSLTDKPKWLTVIDNPHSSWGWGDNGSNTIVIVEDCLAALRVAAVGGYGYPILGTYGVPDLPSGRRVIILPDPDPAGRAAARRHIWNLRNHRPRIIDTGLEPKTIHPDKLQEIIHGQY